jgi:hypothetical protein
MPMTKPVVNALKLAFVCIGILLCLFKTAKAQVPTIDSAGLKLIKISHTDSIRKYEGKLYMSFLGAVVIEHDGIVMNCDSAHLFSEKNFVEAFGMCIYKKPTAQVPMQITSSIQAITIQPLCKDKCKS